MSVDADPIELLFGGMRKLGPGDDLTTLKVLQELPQKEFDLIVDAGCGTGRQTLALAKALHSKIHAIDNYEPFLKTLKQLAIEEGVGDNIETHCMDMADIPSVFKNIDLLWCEGAAYNIGFANALSLWLPAIKEKGFLVVSELAWLNASPPQQVKAFFQLGYPDMKDHEQNIQLAKKAGYDVLGTHVLPQNAWVDGYYDELEPKAKSLVKHEDADVSAFAQETLEEIEVFRTSEGSYGYVFYALQRA